ncbi:MAG: RluA family pseudouridine synthase [Gammaproteobacteria bacterium]|nr:RluA family pseudouridine synthase [Gammaproteobacteria bacterium]
MSIPDQTFTKVSYFKISAAQEGQRIDNFLLKTYKTVPKSKIYKIIRKGEVRVNKGRIKPEYKLKIEDTVRLPPIAVSNKDNTPVFIPKDVLDTMEKSIVFENDHFFVLNKPYGLAVHSGTGLSYGVVDVLKRLRPNQMVELVHRLDRDTSGCLMFAKSRKALVMLQNMLKQSQINKTYIAMVVGQWPAKQKVLDFPLKKYLMQNGEKRVRVEKGGQMALTKVLKVQANKKFSLLTLRLITGRTHQIRVHCQSVGHSIINDDKYGNREDDKQLKKYGFNRMMLHAKTLNIESNELCEAVEISAPVPEVFNKKL